MYPGVIADDPYADLQRVNKEDDFGDLHITRLVAEMADLVRMNKRRFLLTRKAERLRKQDGIYPVCLMRRFSSIWTERGQSAIGRLDGITTLLPGDDLFLYMYVRKEAVLSSQIEGTQSTLNDLLRYESEAAAGQPIDDIREVSNYVDAMLYGLERLDTLPLSLRLIREMHARLLDSGHGASKNPGEFRTTQNWIGGTRPGNAQFVPPAPNDMQCALDELERFIHEHNSGLPALIKAGLLHVRFETIHPFLDGNERTGRQRGRVYCYDAFVTILGEGTNPL